nr:hypothetical protein [uncultured Rhodoferax sp.]
MHQILAKGMRESWFGTVASGPCTWGLSTDGNETSLGTNGLPIFQLGHTTSSGSGLANLVDMTMSDEDVLVTHAGGVTDPHGRAIAYCCHLIA